MTGEQVWRVPPSDEDWELTQIKRDFPEAVAWYGKRTGTWWAMVPVRDRWRLVEAMDPLELRGAIRRPASWPYPRNAVALPSSAPGMSASTRARRSAGTSRGMLE